MEKESVDFLAGLVEAISPSGFEAEAAGRWRKRTSAFAPEVTSDVHGNGIAVLNSSGRPRVMLAGHIDEIGYMITYIDKEGFLYFSAVGGIDLHLVPGHRVWIQTRQGRVLGVIGKKPIHVLESEERHKVVKIEQLWIDIGADSDEAAKKRVSIGDVAVPAAGFEVIHEAKVVGRGFDDKAGAFVVSETLRLLAQEKFSAAVYGVATVQEEIGLRGARTSAYGITPDVGLAVEVTFATDFPGMDKKQIGDISVGKGPVIARGPNINHIVFDLLVRTAEEEKIPYQIEGISRATGTDANVMQLNKTGVATGLVSVPLRYMHTSVEVLSLTDLELTTALLRGFILRLDASMSFVGQ